MKAVEGSDPNHSRRTRLTSFSRSKTWVGWVRTLDLRRVSIARQSRTSRCTKRSASGMALRGVQWSSGRCVTQFALAPAGWADRRRRSPSPSSPCIYFQEAQIPGRRAAQSSPGMWSSLAVGSWSARWKRRTRRSRTCKSTRGPMVNQWCCGRSPSVRRTSRRRARPGTKGGNQTKVDIYKLGFEVLGTLHLRQGPPLRSGSMGVHAEPSPHRVVQHTRPGIT